MKNKTKDQIAEQIEQGKCPECDSVLVKIPSGGLDYDLECEGCGFTATI